MQLNQEVKSAAKANPEVAQAVQELADAAKAEPNPKLAEILAMPNLEKLADKIGQVVMPTSLNNLAGLYDSQGRYSEAKPLYSDALAKCDRILGVNHPLTATIQENLAILQG